MIVLDIDSSVSPTHSDQEGTAYNGHVGCSCYHPLFVFDQFGDLERCALRPGNVHSTDGWRKVLEPAVDRYGDHLAKPSVNCRRRVAMITHQLGRRAIRRARDTVLNQTTSLPCAEPAPSLIHPAILAHASRLDRTAP